jgi:hypothetical protein
MKVQTLLESEESLLTTPGYAYVTYICSSEYPKGLKEIIEELKHKIPCTKFVENKDSYINAEEGVETCKLIFHFASGNVSIKQLQTDIRKIVFNKFDWNFIRGFGRIGLSYINFPTSVVVNSDYIEIDDNENIDYATSSTTLKNIHKSIKGEITFLELHREIEDSVLGLCLLEHRDFKIMSSSSKVAGTNVSWVKLYREHKDDLLEFKTALIEAGLPHLAKI